MGTWAPSGHYVYSKSILIQQPSYIACKTYGNLQSWKLQVAIMMEWTDQQEYKPCSFLSLSLHRAPPPSLLATPSMQTITACLVGWSGSLWAIATTSLVAGSKLPLMPAYCVHCIHTLQLSQLPHVWLHKDIQLHTYTALYYMYLTNSTMSCLAR